MDEQKTQITKDFEEKKAAMDNEGGGKFETTPVIERARETSERLEAANKKQEELLDRQEAMLAKQQLGGEINAGQATEKKVQTPQEYAKSVIAGEHDGPRKE